MLSYYPLDDSTCAATQTKAHAFPDGVCLDATGREQTAGLAGLKFSCSAGRHNLRLRSIRELTRIARAPATRGVAAIPTPGCGLSADPSAPGEWYISTECLGRTTIRT